MNNTWLPNCHGRGKRPPFFCYATNDMFSADPQITTGITAKHQLDTSFVAPYFFRIR